MNKWNTHLLYSGKHLEPWEIWAQSKQKNPNKKPYKTQMHDLPETLPPPQNPRKIKVHNSYGTHFYMSISLFCSQIPLSPVLNHWKCTNENCCKPFLKHIYLVHWSLFSLFKFRAPVILSFWQFCLSSFCSSIKILKNNNKNILNVINVLQFSIVPYHIKVWYFFFKSKPTAM